MLVSIWTKSWLVSTSFSLKQKVFSEGEQKFYLKNMFSINDKIKYSDNIFKFWKGDTERFKNFTFLL